MPTYASSSTASQPATRFNLTGGTRTAPSGQARFVVSGLSATVVAWPRQVRSYGAAALTGSSGTGNGTRSTVGLLFPKRSR